MNSPGCRANPHNHQRISKSLQTFLSHAGPSTSRHRQSNSRKPTSNGNQLLRRLLENPSPTTTTLLRCARDSHNWPSLRLAARGRTTSCAPGIPASLTRRLDFASRQRFHCSRRCQSVATASTGGGNSPLLPPSWMLPTLMHLRTHEAGSSGKETPDDATSMLG